MTGCSVESMDSEELLTADAKYLLASTSEMVFLENVCAGEETVITVNFSQRTNPQGKNLPTNIKVELKVDGVWTEIYQANLNDVTTTSFNYTFADAADYSLKYSAENGPWIATQVLTVINCCDESFTYVDNRNGTYTFTYKVGEDMIGAEVVFTFAQGAYDAGLSNDFSQNGNGQTYKAEMDLTKCDVLEYTITLIPNCSGNGNNQSSNVWTDFKVNDISKKADEDDKFTASCN